MTTGQIMFYGGIAGMVVFILWAIVIWTTFENKKKKLLKEIEEEL